MIEFLFLAGAVAVGMLARDAVYWFGLLVTIQWRSRQ